jgi:uncharacterized membrane protein
MNQPASTPDLGKSSMTMDPKLAGLLAYVLGWLTGIIFYVVEKENRFVRFHAMQSILVFGGLTVIHIGLFIVQMILGVALRSTSLVLLFSAISGILGLIGLVLWILLMIKAYQGVWYKLPMVGDMAEKKA